MIRIRHFSKMQFLGSVQVLMILKIKNIKINIEIFKFILMKETVRYNIVINQKMHTPHPQSASYLLKWPLYHLI